LVIRLYRADWSTNCERVGLALAFKGLEAESVVIDYSERSEVERVSGQGLVPVIEADGEVVHDSTAILRWLEERYPQPALYPSDPARRAEVDVFIDWFNEVWKGTANALEEEMERPMPDPDTVGALGETLDARLDRFEQLLAGRDHLMADQVSAADFIVFPFIKYARSRDSADDELFHRLLDEHQQLEGRPRLAAWIERVDALPRAY
jgi:glutathione S-transferase